MGCCDSIISCLFWIVNFVFAVCGLVIVGVGVLIYTRYESFDKFFDSPVASPPIVLIVLGSIAFVIAFFGCCGAFSRSSCMLSTYAVLVILIFVAQVAIAVVALVNGNTARDFFVKPLMEEFKITGSNQEAFKLFDSLQKELKCCGVNGPQDYLTNPSGPIASCYGTKGCASVLADFVDDNAVIIGAVGIGIAILEVFGAVTGFLLSSYLKRTI